MLPLIQVLSHGWPDSFDNWVIAKACYCIHCSSPPSICRTSSLRQTAKYAVLQAQEQTADGLACRSLTITLAAPRQETAEGNETFSAENASFPQNPDRNTILFTRDMVQEYLQAAGDSNPLHRTGKIVVPGLLILAECQKYLLYEISPAFFPPGADNSAAICAVTPPITLEARFYRPVYAGQAIQLTSEQSSLTGLRSGERCFSIILTHHQ